MTEEQPEGQAGAEPAAPERPAYRAAAPRVLPPGELHLSVGDGFKFGCGFIMAAAIGLLVGVLALALGFLLASLLGVPLPLGA